MAGEVYNSLSRGKGVQRCLIDLHAGEWRVELAGFAQHSAGRD
jgi:hypothetical protein